MSEGWSSIKEAAARNPSMFLLVVVVAAFLWFLREEGKEYRAVQEKAITVIEHNSQIQGQVIELNRMVIDNFKDLEEHVADAHE